MGYDSVVLRYATGSMVLSKSVILVLLPYLVLGEVGVDPQRSSEGHFACVGVIAPSESVVLVLVLT